MEDHEYPPPPWRLRRLVYGPVSFWEVAPEMFIGAENFLDATNTFIQTAGTASPFHRVMSIYGNSPEVTEVAFLRDFGDYHEVVPGWCIWNEDGREEAERAFARLGGGNAIGKYGVPVANLLHDRRIRVTKLVARSIESPEKPPLKPLRKWVSQVGAKRIFWEVAPGRLCLAESELSAREYFTAYGAVATLPRDPTIAEYSLIQEATDIVPATRKPLRRFRDSEGDIWFYVEDVERLYCGSKEEEARENALADGDEVEHAFAWGPFTELDRSGDPIATFTTPEELMGVEAPKETSPDDTDSTEDEPKEAPKMSAAVHVPPFLPVLEDSYSRNWFEVHKDRWVVYDADRRGGDLSLEEQAADSWDRFIKRGGPEASGFGRSRESITEGYGPMKDKGFVELKPRAASFSQEELVGSVVTRERCHCTKLDDDEKEREKWFRLDNNTFCVDCGKLRP